MPRKSQLCLFAAICYAAGMGTALAIEGGRIYRDDGLKVEFRLPAGWQKRSCSISNPGTLCLGL